MAKVQSFEEIVKELVGVNEVARKLDDLDQLIAGEIEKIGETTRLPEARKMIAQMQEFLDA